MNFCKRLNVKPSNGTVTDVYGTVTDVFQFLNASEGFWNEKNRRKLKKKNEKIWEKLKIEKIEKKHKLKKFKKVEEIFKKRVKRLKITSKLISKTTAMSSMSWFCIESTGIYAIEFHKQEFAAKQVYNISAREQCVSVPLSTKNLFFCIYVFSLKPVPCNGWQNREQMRWVWPLEWYGFSLEWNLVSIKKVGKFLIVQVMKRYRAVFFVFWGLRFYADSSPHRCWRLLYCFR